MKRKRILIFILAVLVFATLAFSVICFLKRSRVEAVLYYISADGSELVEKEKSIRYEKNEEIPLKIIESLMSGGGFSLVSPIPKNTTVNTVVYEGEEKLTVDFSEKFVENSENSSMSVYAVIKSICSASPLFGVTKIRITCGGKEIKNIGYLSDEDIVIGEEVLSSETECVLYFLDKSSGQIRGEKRSVLSSGGALEKAIVDALANGPVSDELEAVIGENTSVTEAETVKGICYVDFSSFEDLSGADLGIYSVVKSLTSLDKINEVKFLVDGKSVDKIGNVDVTNPIKQE